MANAYAGEVAMRVFLKLALLVFTSCSIVKSDVYKIPKSDRPDHVHRALFGGNVLDAEKLALHHAIGIYNAACWKEWRIYASFLGSKNQLQPEDLEPTTLPQISIECRQ